MASSSLSQLETVSGVEPSRDKVPFQVTTLQAKAFIQKDFEEVDCALIAGGKLKADQSTRVDLATIIPDKISEENGMKEKAKLERLQWKAEHAENERQAKRLWVEYNRKYKEYRDKKYLNFYPFLLMLSPNVLKYERKKKRPEIFDINRDSDKINLRDFYYKLIEKYIFSPKEASMFNKRDWMQSYGIKDVRCGRDLLLISKPRIIGADGRPIRMYEFDPWEHMGATVYFMVDPRRIFNHMLRPKDNRSNKRYDIVINEVEPITPKNYRYNVDRELVTKSSRNNENDRIYNQIKDLISGA